MGLRPYDHQKSVFCYKTKSLESLEDPIQRTKACYVFLSYNSEGLMPEDEAVSVMKRY